MSATTAAPLPGRTGPPTAVRVRAGGLRGVGTLHTLAGRRTALGTLLAGAGLLYSVGLSGSGWANPYYSAAAQAGALDWQAFFFGALDPAGAISVDKPPAALWLMGLSVRTFGLSTQSLILPQALCMVAAIALLYGAVRRQALAFGTGQHPDDLDSTDPGTAIHTREARAAAVGLIAAAVLALTPVVVLLARFNNPDTLMVFLSVAAAYALARSVEKTRGGGGWLAGAGVLLGLAFLTKLLQAWLIVPAFVAVALVAGAGSLGRRLIRTAAAGAVMVVAAGWWVLAVQLTPATDRPWVGGTQGNSMFELALGYNGFGRLTGQDGGPAISRSGAWLRLFGSWGSEAGWLLPAALAALVAGLVLTRGRDRRDPLRAGLLLWAVWLLGAGIVLSSLQGISHSYYAIQLAPAIAGAVALGGALVWQRIHEDGVLRAKMILAAVVSLTAVWSIVLMLKKPGWPLAVVPIALVAAGVAVNGLSAERIRRFWVGAAILVAMLAGPAAWSLATAQAVHRGTNVYSGPGVTVVHTQAGFSPGSTAILPNALVEYVRNGAAGYDWAAAVVGRRAADLQLSSGAPVWELDGFAGTDPYPRADQFRSAVNAARVHYLVVPAGGVSGSAAAQDIVHWALGHHPSTQIGTWLLIDLTA